MRYHKTVIFYFKSEVVMRLKTRFILFFFIVFPFVSHGATIVVLFGGGFTPNTSQVSIELNARWIYNILNKKPGNDLEVYYTDGNSSGVDVRQIKISNHGSKKFEPLARIYSDYTKNGISFYSSNLIESVKTSDLDNISKDIDKLLLNSSSEDDVILIYQGHGGYNESNTNKNYLKLWNNTRLTVFELESLISNTSTDATVRFFLPQCYSGAFTRLIYDKSDIELGLASGKRCGFVSQREDRISEGCTDSVNLSGYKDYSSYFFSAIDNKTIDGKSITTNPDIDNTGSVSLYEAHIYSLINAHSIDYPRSTSEEYLLNWQPWYLKWLPNTNSVDNTYSRVSDSIAENIGIETKHDNVIKKVSEMLASNKANMMSKKDQRNLLKDTISKIQASIKHEIEMQWPSIKYPYTIQFNTTIVTNVQNISNAIISNEQYNALAEAQTLSLELKKDLLNLQRDQVQLVKILEMRRLSRILNQFDSYASEKHKNEYNQILDCENFVL